MYNTLWNTKKSGFTLIETTLYIALLSILLFSLFTFLGLVFEVRVQGQVIREVEEQGAFVMDKIVAKVRKGDKIKAPTMGTHGTSLVLSMPTDLPPENINTNGVINLGLAAGVHRTLLILSEIAPEPIEDLTVKTLPVASVISSRATLGGRLASQNLTDVTGWFVLDTQPAINCTSPTTLDVGLLENHAFSVVAEELLPATQYYYRACVDEGGVSQDVGGVVSFTSLSPEIVLTAETIPAINLGEDKIILAGNVVSSNNEEGALVWLAVETNPTVDCSVPTLRVDVVDYTSGEDFYIPVTGLSSSTDYYFKTCSSLGPDEVSGAVETFRTKIASNPTPSSGSLTVCQILMNQNQNIIDGSDLLTPLTLSQDITAGGFSETVVFTTPLTLNHEAIAAHPGPDAACQVFDNLDIKAYYYVEGILSEIGELLYNDQYDMTVDSLHDFFGPDRATFDVVDGILHVTEGAGDMYALHNDRVKISNFDIDNRMHPGSWESLHITFTLSSNTPSLLRQYNYKKTFQGGMTLRDYDER